MSLHNKINVLLPAWIFEQAEDKQQLQRLILKYMRKYPRYTVIKVKGHFAICEME